MNIDHWFKCLKEKQTLVFIIMFFVRDIELGSQILWLCITRFFVRYRASWKIVENPSRPYSWKQVIDTAKKGSVLQAHRLFGKVSNSKILIQTFAKFDCSQSSSIGCNLFLPQITPATPPATPTTALPVASLEICYLATYSKTKWLPSVDARMPFHPQHCQYRPNHLPCPPWVPFCRRTPQDLAAARDFQIE